MDKEIFTKAYAVRIKIKGYQKMLDKANSVLEAATSTGVKAPLPQLRVFLNVDDKGQIEFLEDTELANELAHIQKKYCEAKIEQLEAEFKQL